MVLQAAFAVYSIPPECLECLQSFLKPKLCPKCNEVLSERCAECGEACSCCIHDDFFLQSDFDHLANPATGAYDDMGFWFCLGCHADVIGRPYCDYVMLTMMLRLRGTYDAMVPLLAEDDAT